MAATWHLGGDSGTATGSPTRGTTRYGIGNTNYVTNVSWKSVDDLVYSGGGTAPASAPVNVSVGGPTVYSMPTYLYGIFSGSFTTISNGKFYHSSGTCSTGNTIAGLVTSTYSTPVATVLSGTSDMSTAVSSSSGLTVLFSTTDPSAASPTTTLTAAGYSQYCVSQLAIANTASAGTQNTLVITFSYDEV